MIDDFRNERSVVDCKKFGDSLKVFDAWRVGSEHRGYQESEDSIAVFLNFKKLLDTKNREEAQRKLDKLIRDCPPEFNKEIEQLKHYLKI